MSHSNYPHMFETLADLVTAGEVIFPLTAFREEHPGTWANILKELKAEDDSTFQYLGSGKKGSAYKFGSDRVVKFTVDDSETQAMATVIDQETECIVKVYDVFKVDIGQKRDVGVILQEFLQEGDTDWKDFGEIATFYYHKILVHPFDAIALGQFKDWCARRFDRLVSGHAHTRRPRTMTAEESTKVDRQARQAPERPPDNLFIRETQPDRPFGDWVRQGAKMPTEEMFEWFDVFCQELAKFGISFWDLNGGNMCRRGTDHVVIDLGFSTVKSPPDIRRIESAARSLEMLASRLSIRKIASFD